ncbi:MAG TPA: peptidoglycan DD-metalloendopeptidase family protein [Protaetiibacter sp.]|nr:peptidoglycan DD-metalloendopeptidase family protein [Protaetiibacter sp.]
MQQRGNGRVRSAGSRTIALVAGAALAVTVSVQPAIAAPAADFPSWSDVQAAKRDEASARAQLKSLNASIAAAQQEVDRTQAEAEARGTAYAEAQQAYDEQSMITLNVKTQAEAAQAEADQARLESRQLIANLAKQGGGGDLTAGLLGDTGGAEGYLYRIGTMQKVTQHSDAVYANAVQLQKTATSLAEQELIEEAKLEELKADAQAKFELAQEAAIAAQQQYDALQEAKAKAEALVAFLTDRREVTERDYQEGLRQKWGSGAAGEVSATGWARPAAGRITSNFGWRIDPINGSRAYHSGVDLAGGCGIPIYAAHAGTVVYAGWYGTWGNYIRIEHGNGYNTGYAHIMPGGIGVHIGQEVGPGQLIARVGTTGHSTGCHLHFIVRSGETLIDPVPFMRNQGITLG